MSRVEKNAFLRHAEIILNGRVVAPEQLEESWVLYQGLDIDSAKMTVIRDVSRDPFVTVPEALAARVFIANQVYRDEAQRRFGPER